MSTATVPQRAWVEQIMGLPVGIHLRGDRLAGERVERRVAAVSPNCATSTPCSVRTVPAVTSRRGSAARPPGRRVTATVSHPGAEPG
jgi:hypothetical protein